MADGFSFVVLYSLLDQDCAEQAVVKLTAFCLSMSDYNLLTKNEPSAFSVRYTLMLLCIVKACLA